MAQTIYPPTFLELYDPMSSPIEPQQLYFYSEPVSCSSYDPQYWEDLPPLPADYWNDDVSFSTSLGSEVPAVGLLSSDSTPEQNTTLPIPEVSFARSDSQYSCNGYQHSGIQPLSRTVRSGRASSSSSVSSAMSRSSTSCSFNSLLDWGVPVPQTEPSDSQMWRCAYPSCRSSTLFMRGCDLRKHYRRHLNTLFCRVDGCPQSEACVMAESNGRRHVPSGGVFSSKKDRSRHEAKHDPNIRCEWHGPDGRGCNRMFSRKDNMKDHVRRMHSKKK